ncbi:hypothetical protein FUAX_48170 (plasmid) [Fulvitalea axinellae]|uniref:F5/8 type C domain-containing protein n=1 Tax=Fulvitalea axinellae TaxID=1182444 RepID=A0AAU9DMG6_9BACT|nr:hypothetical protein FUAX_48170 [Fulvitalea axinellae]
MKRNILKAFVLAFAMLATACDKEEVKYDPPVKPVFETKPIYVLNDLSQYWKPFLGLKDEGNFATYIDFAKQQYTGISHPVISKINFNGVNALNVFLNTESPRSYTVEDKKALEEYLKTGGGLAFFAMGEGDGTQNEITNLTSGYGFSFVGGNVENPSANWEGHGTVAKFNKGSLLQLDNVSEWTIVAKSGSAPLIAYREFGGGVVLASGIDIFGKEQPGNVAFYQDLLLKLVDHKPAFVSDELFKPDLVQGESFVLAGSRIFSNGYYAEEVKEFAPLYKEIVEKVSEWAEVDKPTEGNFTVSVLPGEIKGWNGEKDITLGLAYGGYPETKTKSVARTAEVLVAEWLKPKRESLDKDAFSIFVGALIAEDLGYPDAMAETVDPLIDFAENHPDFDRYDPVTMSKEELDAFPEKLGQGKYLKALKELYSKFGEDIVRDYVKLKLDLVPTIDGFEFSGSDVAWLWAKATEDFEDGGDKRIFSLFNDLGYQVDREQVSIPASVDSEKLNTEWWNPYIPSQYTHSSFDISNIFDGDFDAGGKGTWHSVEWKPDIAPYPHTIEVDMFDRNKITSFVYYPRNVTWHQHMAHIKFYVTDDKNDKGEAVAEFIWRKPWTPDGKKIYCTKFKTGRYFFIEILESWVNDAPEPKGKNSTSICELEVYGAPASKENN